MTEHKSHRIRIDHLPQSKPLCTVDTKSRTVVICAWVVSLCILLAKSLLAIPFIFLAVILTINKGKPVYEGYEDRFVIYKEDDSEFCQMLWHADIHGWEYRITDKGDRLHLYMKDGETIKLSDNIDRRLYHYFAKVLPDREVRRNKE